MEGKNYLPTPTAVRDPRACRLREAIWSHFFVVICSSGVCVLGCWLTRESCSLVKIELIFMSQIKARSWESVTKKIYNGPWAPCTGGSGHRSSAQLPAPSFLSQQFAAEVTSWQWDFGHSELILICLRKPDSAVWELRTRSIEANQVPKGEK